MKKKVPAKKIVYTKVNIKEESDVYKDLGKVITKSLYKLLMPIYLEIAKDVKVIKEKLEGIVANKEEELSKDITVKNQDGEEIEMKLGDKHE